MKKLTVLVAAIFMLAGCGSGGSNEATKSGTAQTTPDKDGNYASASITLKGDKIETISLDETKGGKSKKELGADYNMKADSSIKKEWNEQITALEEYIVKNGFDKIELDDSGKAKNNDILTGCTISISNVLEAAKEAKESAK